MNEDPEEEYEEEEIFVYADLETILSSDELNEPNALIKIIGIDSDNPIMQINNKIFKGTYDYAVGTNVFFIEDENHPQQDEVFCNQPEIHYKHFTSTNKILKMKRIFIQPVVEEVQTDSTVETDVEKANRLIINKTYGEALNQFLKNNEEAPRKIDPSETHGTRTITKKDKRKNDNKGNDDNDEKVDDDDDDKINDDDEKDEDYVPYDLDAK